MNISPRFRSSARAVGTEYIFGISVFGTTGGTLLVPTPNTEWPIFKYRIPIPPVPKKYRMTALLERAIAQGQSNKAPGADGIPLEVYRHAGSELKQSLLSLFKDCWTEGRLPLSFKDARIKAIEQNVETTEGSRFCRLRTVNHRTLKVDPKAFRVSL